MKKYLYTLTTIISLSSLVFAGLTHYNNSQVAIAYWNYKAMSAMNQPQTVNKFVFAKQ